MRKTLSRFIPQAIICQLVYWLLIFRISIDKLNPFVLGGRGIYEVYAKVYFFIMMGIFTAYVAKKIRNIFKGREEAMIYSPALFLFFYAAYSLFANAQYTHAAAFIFLFILVVMIKPGLGISGTASGFKEVFYKKEYIYVIIIFAAAFTMKFLFYERLLHMAGDRFLMASDDGLTYAPYALDWAHGRIPENGTYWGGFGYWVFLGSIYRIFGDCNHLAMALIQSLMGASVPVAVFYIAKTVFSRPAAFIASALTALDLNLTFLSTVIGMEALYIPMFYLSLSALTVFFCRQGTKKSLYAAGIGILFGFANVVRGELVFFAVITAVFIPVFFAKQNGLRRAAVIGTIFLAGFFMPLTLHAVRNHANYGKFTFSSGQAKACFKKAAHGITENEKLHNMGFNPFESPERSVETFKSRPGDVAGLLFNGFCKRAALFLFIPNFGTFDPLILINPGSGYKYHYSLYLLFYGYILVALGAVFAFMDRKAIFIKTLLVSFIFSLVLIYGAIYVTNARHRGVAIPIFYSFLGYGAAVLYGRIKHYEKSITRKA